MISFAGVVVRYPKAVSNAVDGVTFSALPGRVTALAGPNGSGKSTLVRALLRQADLVSGSIEIDGRKLSSIPQRELALSVAALTQREESSFPSSVRDYAALGRFPHLGLWKAPGSADHDAVSSALSRAGVADLAGRSTAELSGGEWQRVRVARALAQQARALVVDEPTTFLDIAHEMAIFELLHNLAAGGITVLVVSHQLNLVARFADEMMLLKAGKVAASGTPDEVMRKDRLEQVFEWPVTVTRDPVSHAPALFPLRSGESSGISLPTVQLEES